MPMQQDDRVLVDFRTSDDAGVYRWDDHSALVQTVDFFTPVVDDPALYGAIAAANALSDVYAMGGRPLTALAVAGFPQDAINAETIGAIFRGGFHKLREAGVALLGGHTVQDREIKFGYAVTGVVDPEAIWSNAGARLGDALFLTKPLGTGVISTAAKFERAPEPAVTAAIEVMLRLNRAAAEALGSLPRGAVGGCTDVTGFGLLGHASEMAAASRVTFRISAGALPLIEGAMALAEANRSGGMKSNQSYFGGGVSLGPGLSDAETLLLFDPQTSGGLLVTVAPSCVDAAIDAWREAGVDARRVGAVEARSGPLVVVE